MMKSCKEMSYLLSAQLDRPLSLGERVELRLHLMLCVGCRNLAHDMLRLRQFSRQAAGAPREE